jgi:hypothetical protein
MVHQVVLTSVEPSRDEREEPYIVTYLVEFPDTDYFLDQVGNWQEAGAVVQRLAPEAIVSAE